MRIRPTVFAAVAALLLSGCAAFEPYVIESELGLENRLGVSIWEYTYENPWDGSQYIQWEAYNPSDRYFCAQVAGDVSTQGGASWNGVYLLAPGASEFGLGWMDLYGYYSYQVEFRLWSLDGASCGSYPE
jgi:hypothetical protein